MSPPARRRMAGRQPTQLLFWTWFNTLAFGRARRTVAWTETRFRFWLAFTLRSIRAQGVGDWRYWLVCSRALLGDGALDVRPVLAVVLAQVRIGGPVRAGGTQQIVVFVQAQ